MKPVVKTIVVLILISLCVSGSSRTTSDRKFDEFGDINCEDEWARLDNFAVHLQNEPAAHGYIIFYGGRRMRGRLPRRGEAAIRASRLKPYLVENRGIPTAQVVVVDGGFRESWEAELWIVPPGAAPPSPTPTVSPGSVKFRKGGVKLRQFSCLMG